MVGGVEGGHQLINFGNKIGVFLVGLCVVWALCTFQCITIALEMSNLLAVVANNVGALIVGSVLHVGRLFALVFRLLDVSKFHWGVSGTLGWSGSALAVAFYVVDHVGGTLSKCKRLCKRLRIQHCNLQLNIFLQTNHKFVAKVIIIWAIRTHLYYCVSKYLDVWRDSFGLLQPIQLVTQFVEMFNVRKVLVKCMFKLIKRVGLSVQSMWWAPPSKRSTCEQCRCKLYLLNRVN